MINGLIIRNGLVPNSSWGKRVSHWQASFAFEKITTEIVSVYPILNFPSARSKLINKYFNLYYNNQLRYFLSPFIILYKLIRFKPDFVLLANGGFWEFFTIPIYCKLMGIPLLVDMVDTIGRKYKSKKSLIDQFIILNKVLFDYIVVKNAYEIFVISSVLQKEYQSRFPQKKITMSIPSTVDINSFEINSQIELEEFQSDHYLIFDSDEFIKIFYAGTITRLNGVEFFFSCISEILKSSDINIKLIFAVIQGNVEDLFKLSVKYNLNHLLVVVPPVKQVQLPALLKRADILFIPEQGNETANAGFPGKTSEYLLSGTPVITTEFSDLNYYLFDGVNACISKMGDKESYKSSLTRLISEIDFRNYIGKNGKKTAIDQFNHLNSCKPYYKSISGFYNISPK